MYLVLCLSGAVSNGEDALALGGAASTAIGSCLGSNCYTGVHITMPCGFAANSNAPAVPYTALSYHIASCASCQEEESAPAAWARGHMQAEPLWRQCSIEPAGSRARLNRLISWQPSIRAPRAADVLHASLVVYLCNVTPFSCSIAFSRLPGSAHRPMHVQLLERPRLSCSGWRAIALLLGRDAPSIIRVAHRDWMDTGRQP